LRGLLRDLAIALVGPLGPLVDRERGVDHGLDDDHHDHHAGEQHAELARMAIAELDRAPEVVAVDRQDRGRGHPQALFLERQAGRGLVRDDRFI
jgi:hypothetical protein